MSNAETHMNGASTQYMDVADRRLSEGNYVVFSQPTKPSCRAGVMFR
jgi:hypothetical protein